MGEFLMPSLGADMEAGTLVEWLTQPGAMVKRGDIVAVVETDKGAIEIEIFEEGVVERLLVETGSKVPVGTPLASIRGSDEARLPAAAANIAPSAVPPSAIAPLAQPVPPPAIPSAARAPAVAARTSFARQRVSPAARKLAAQRGIDPARLPGTGPEGAIVSTDVAKAAASPPTPRAPSRGSDPSAMRRAIGAAMARSKREIPHYYLSRTVDATASLAWLEGTNAKRSPGERLLLQVLILKAVAFALRDRRQFNGFYTADGFVPSDRIHIGTAVAVRGSGLVAPAIHDADRLTVDELMVRLRDLVARARGGTLRSSELSDATITVSSLGERGAEALYGVIYPPQVAILGFGAPAMRPWVVDSQVTPRTLMMTSLSGDHRVTDGHLGSLLLADIDRHLQQPEDLSAARPDLPRGEHSV